MDKKNFMVTKTFKIGIMIVNICLIVGLVGYIFYMHNRLEHAERAAMELAPDVSADGYTEEQLAQMMEQAEDSMIGIYSRLLAGSTARFSDGTSMNFLADGVFNGYFDAAHTDVKDYSYVVSKCDDNYLADVNVCDKKESKYVRYKLLYNDESNLTLYYPEDNVYVVLEY